jgi:multidrug efflux system membrane fusion protein
MIRRVGLRFFVVTIFVSLVAVSIFTGCTKSNSTPAAGQKRGGVKFPVEIAVVESRNTEFNVRAVGSVEAYEIVQVTARVPGIVRAVRFIEGDAVRRGEALIEIEPDRYQLALQSAEAQFRKAHATLEETRSGLDRRTEMLQENPGFVSKEELENWQTRTRGFEADSAQAAANLEVAKLNLRDALVPAPEGGVIQTRSVRTGQYVQTGTVVATLVKRDPLLLRFGIPEQDAGRVRPGLTALFTVRGEEHEFTAKITAVTESADPATRMVSVTAEVNDPQRAKLRPGSFAEVTVHLGEAADLPVIPQISIRPSERGFLAYVVEDSTVRERILALGMQTADGFVEVRSGVEAGERIVIRGAEALRDKAGIRIVQKLDSAHAKTPGNLPGTKS